MLDMKILQANVLVQNKATPTGSAKGTGTQQEFPKDVAVAMR